MRQEQCGKILKIFIDETDTWHGEPLYHAIIAELRRHDLAGATILRGIEGFGSHHHLHTTRILRLSDNLPVMIEIVDTPEHIDQILDIIEPMMKNGIAAVVKDATIWRFGKEAADEGV